MQDHYGNYRPPERYRASYFLVAMVGAIIGALLIVALIPQLVPYMQELDVLPTVERTEAPSPTPEEEPSAAAVPDPTPAPPAVTSDFEEVVKSVARESEPSVVTVVNVREVRDMWGRVFEQDGQGSGVVIDDDGHIVTNYHVIEDAREIVVEAHDGRTLEATLVGEDAPTDLAVLKVDPEGLEPLEFADSDAVEVGQLAIAIGNPLGREFARSVTVGVVSGVRATMYGQAAHQRVFQLIQTDASINPGNSGGALLDSDARIVGINTLKFASAEVEGMGFAIPSNTVARITDQLIRDGEVVRAWMGVTVAEIDEAAQRGIDVPDRGVFVQQVASPSPAASAGMRQGDVIISAGGKHMDYVIDLLMFLEESRPDQEVEFEVIRDGETRVKQVQLTTMPR